MRLTDVPSPSIPGAWSPSALNVLMSCGLRSAYDNDPLYRSRFRRENTYSVMGMVAHELTRKAWTGGFNSTVDAEMNGVLRAEWDRLISLGFTRLSDQWTPAVVPVPDNWPYFSVTKQATIKRVSEEVRKGRARTPGEGEGSVRVERRIIDETLGLEGIPDRVILTGEGFYVLDVKTGHSVDAINADYRRQLLIYAHLVSTTTVEPLLGIGVVTAGGCVHWEHVTQSDVDVVLDEARFHVDKFRIASKTGGIVGLASPAPDTCRFCPYRNVCNAYWRDDAEDWSELRGVVGRVERVVDSTTLVVRQSLPAVQEGDLVGVSACPHSVNEGDEVSIVDAMRRGNALRGNWYSRVHILSGSP